ncbi:MAG: hypothetical protein COS37_04030 [Anaerolineae bacterium CG03_land_8_20_14_0_80_58_20]|nr:MAG: hypothetical protein AUJ21_01600 [Anaerolineae bacterium CG1_02_58_13]PIV26902.1 MAG: hypothetical protein COS37_04030 [Anaerolineae bacterium CG03_land_8_20_14_0_80_58_20]
MFLEDPMSDLFEKVTNAQDIFKNLASKIPGFGGYVERQNRRAADKLLRETVANRYEELYSRASALQTDLVSGGMIAYVDDMEKAVIKIRTFIDKISRAAYGASGLFDAVKINEKELAQLYAFDNAFFDLADQTNRALDTVEASLADEAALPAAIRNLTTLAREAVTTFEKRGEVITSG